MEKNITTKYDVEILKKKLNIIYKIHRLFKVLTILCFLSSCTKSTEFAPLPETTTPVAAPPVNTALPTTSILSMVSLSIDENTGGNQTIYNAAVSINLTNLSNMKYSLKNIDDSLFFSIDIAGVVKLINSPNFESKASYSVTVLAEDADANIKEQSIILSINDINEAPTLASVPEGSIVEILQSVNTTDTNLLGNLVGADVDAADAFIYGIDGVEPIGLISTRVGAYGTLIVNTDGSFEYTQDTVAIEALIRGQIVTDEFTVTVKDLGGLVTKQIYSVKITGADEVLTLATGFKFTGGAAYEKSGVSVSHAGDMNGDGFADVIIGAEQIGAVDSQGQVIAAEGAGVSYVIFGRAGGLPAKLKPADLDGTNGFKLVGDKVGDKAGFSVRYAGDVNGDSFDDIIIGGHGANNKTGVSYVVFGARAIGASGQINLATLNASTGLIISGAAINDFSGFSVSGAGDINGDSYADIIIGARGVNGAGRNDADIGAAYVVYGKATNSNVNINLATLTGSTGFRLIGEQGNDFSGSAVSGAGDVNGDGYDDVLVGANRADGPLGSGISNSGAAYVVYGRASGLGGNTGTFNLATLDDVIVNASGSLGFKLTGAAEQDFTGISVSAIGDMNGDGFADLAVGADQSAFAAGGPGVAYVVFGQRAAFVNGNLNLSALNGNNGFKLTGEESNNHTGRSVSGAGDVNGDGLADLIIGAPHADASFPVDPILGPLTFYNGAAYVIFGKTSGFAADLPLTNLNVLDGIKIFAENTADESGTSVSGAGDVNGDGFADIIIGAPYADMDPADPTGVTSAFSGAAYIIYGRQF